MASNSVHSVITLRDSMNVLVRPLRPENEGLGAVGINIYAGSSAAEFYVSEDVVEVLIGDLTKALAMWRARKTEQTVEVA